MLRVQEAGLRLGRLAALDVRLPALDVRLPALDVRLPALDVRLPALVGCFWLGKPVLGLSASPLNRWQCHE
ncbi:hypothetical protein SAMN05216215_1010149 [Saccharopolyspora shandongensis]|uniref:Uncharacterized protein n=1 Tax=Saccharopolyspora shandongensis TaxID=418495 RepID=A0A1H3BCL7_9PSEU|nr:hypothetical protein SAMN05216215_1010149 [Saccharopolyspora shandongensis]